MRMKFATKPVRQYPSPIMHFATVPQEMKNFELISSRPGLSVRRMSTHVLQQAADCDSS